MQIIHILRAPIGGLFRHVCDLVKVQSGLGHRLGVICDSTSGGEQANAALAELEAHCELGVVRMPMPRLPGIGDLGPIRTIVRLVDQFRPDILHGHGAKGGLYARLAKRPPHAATVYTPHGGALHYAWTSPQGALFLAAERALLGRTSGLTFVCNYERDTFSNKVGLKGVAHQVVHNGLWPEEFEPVIHDQDADDLLFVGELRLLKGVDVLINAVAQLSKTDPVSLTIVGDGPDRAMFESSVKQLGLSDHVRFAGVLPAREAFRLGRIMVVPSRAESFPYIVLETIAAGLPIVATRVGGIAEVLPCESLVFPNDINGLTQRLEIALGDPESFAASAREISSKAAESLSVAQMGQKITEFYDHLLA